SQPHSLPSRRSSYLKLSIPSKDLITNLKDLGRFEEHEIIFLETGKSGEPLTTLQKMASSRHTSVSIKDGDKVIIVTTPSYDMERSEEHTSELQSRFD